MPAPTVTATDVLSVNAAGATTFEVGDDSLGDTASTVKLMTAYTARRWVSNVAATITVQASDLVGGSTANLLNGDVLTYEDAFYGMMLPSGNDAATALARSVGQVILTAEGGSGSALARFVTEMNTQAAALGFTGATFADVTGLGEVNSVRPSHLVQLARVIGVGDGWLRTVMGTLSRTITITGANARSYLVSHTINPTGTVGLPEFEAGKTGTNGAAGACVVLLWDHPDGSRHVTGVFGSTSADRFTDLRSVMDWAGVDLSTLVTTATTGVIRSGQLVSAQVARTIR